MKLILSRKGFDSGKESGGCPSPIFPDDAMFSLPIPDDGGARPTYEDLCCTQADIGKLVHDLTARRSDPINAAWPVHMSPDLNPPSGCPKLFDQVDAAEGHLNNQGVKEGDLFLFFGLYRNVQKTSNGQVWRFDPNAPRKHVLWGWLRVGAIHKPEKGAVLRCSCGNSNTRYVASDRLDLGGGKALGAGVFPRFNERLLLTIAGHSVSHWKLPRWFYPDGDKEALSHHRDRNRVLKSRILSPDPWEPRWKPDNDDYAYLESVGRGQEFVLDCNYYPEAIGWALDLIRDLGQR